MNILFIGNLELAWIWSKHAPTLFLTDLLKILNTRLDSVSKIQHQQR